MPGGGPLTDRRSAQSSRCNHCGRRSTRSSGDEPDADDGRHDGDAHDDPGPAGSLVIKEHPGSQQGGQHPRHHCGGPAAATVSPGQGHRDERDDAEHATADDDGYRRAGVLAET